jgi:hypothetical protein
MGQLERMAGLRLTVAAVSIAILSGMTATAACAAPAAKAPLTAPTATFTTRDAFASDLNQWGPQQNHKALQWDSRKGHWGLKLDMDQSTFRDMGWNDVQAGAYYKVTPSLHVGGAFSMTSPQQNITPAIPQDRASGVKLEGAFKF